MKYIRTEDGILKTENLKLVEDDRFGRRYINCYNFPYIPLKEADTIDELCDGYYLYNGYDDKFNPDRIYTTDEKTKALDDCKDLAFHIDLMCRGRYICELRAFIETDKGLIFIGKFNENGELVLI